jgi:hypothetical protein
MTKADVLLAELSSFLESPQGAGYQEFSGGTITKDTQKLRHNPE